MFAKVVKMLVSPKSFMLWLWTFVFEGTFIVQLTLSVHFYDRNVVSQIFMRINELVS